MMNYITGNIFMIASIHAVSIMLYQKIVSENQIGYQKMYIYIYFTIR